MIEGFFNVLVYYYVNIISNPLTDVIGRQSARINSLNTTDRLVMGLVDIMLAWGVSASLAYWLVLIARWPVWTWYPAVAVIFGAVIHLCWNRFKWTSFAVFNVSAAGLLIVCLVSASINVFTNRPDGDDISFSHRAFVAVTNLSAPIAMTDTRHDVVDLPPLTPIHVFTSIEVTTALVAHALGVSQPLALHMGLGTLTNFMLPAIYFLLLRFFRIRTRYALLGTAGVLLFFAMSGNVHRDWGNFTVVRSWQGKCILIEIILPLALLYSLRFLLYGRRSDSVRIHAAMCCGIGLSGSGIFLVPFVIGTAAFAAWMTSKFSRSSLVRGLQCSSTLLQPLVVSALPWLGFLPKLGEISGYTQGWSTDWQTNLALVFHAKSVPLYLAYLGTALLMRKRVELFTFLAYLGVATAFLTAPGISKLLMDVVTPGAYWRFAYALFVPLYVGLALAGISRLIVRSGLSRVLGLSWLGMLVLATLVVKHPALNPEIVAAPGLKFHRDIMESIYAVSALAQKHSVVLAPESVVSPLGLLRPDIRFIVTRPSETLHVFVDAGRTTDGEVRGRLGAALESCDFAKAERVRVEELWPDVSLVVFPARCGMESVRDFLSLGSGWQVVSLGNYYALSRVMPQ